MNLLRDAPSWAHLMLVLLLIAAAAQDVVQRRISNGLCLAVIVAAVAAALAAGPRPALWQNAMLFALVLGASLPAFGAGWLGGGDVKLLAAVALWVDFSLILPLLALIFLTGGVIALVSIAVRRKALRRSAKGVPYGVAIAVGTLAALAQPILFHSRHAGADPLDLRAARALGQRR